MKTTLLLILLPGPLNSEGAVAFTFSYFNFLDSSSKVVWVWGLTSDSPFRVGATTDILLSIAPSKLGSRLQGSLSACRVPRDCPTRFTLGWHLELMQNWIHVLLNQNLMVRELIVIPYNFAIEQGKLAFTLWYSGFHLSQQSSSILIDGIYYNNYLKDDW